MAKKTDKTEKVDEAVAEEVQTAPQPPVLNVSEIQMMVQLIDAVAEKGGILRGGDLTPIGNLYVKLSNIVSALTQPPAAPASDAPDAGEEAAAEKAEG